MAKKIKEEVVDALSQVDLLRMLLQRARLGEAKALHDLHSKNLKHEAVLEELNAARLEAQTQRNLMTCQVLEKASKEVVAAETAKSRILAEEMAKRYAVDWKTASFDPLTGAIVRHPGEA